MKNPDDINGQPAVTVVEIDDPTTINAGMELLDLEAVQLQAAPLRARRIVVRLEGATVVYHSTNLRIRTRTRVLEGLLAYTAFGPHATGTVNGLPVRPGLMLSVEPNTEVTFVVDAGYESVALLVPEEEIRTHLRFRRRESEFRPPRGLEPLRVDSGMALVLFDWGKRLVETAAAEPALFDERKENRLAARIELIETLLSTLGAAGDFEPDRSEQAKQAQSLIVKSAEDFALSHRGELLYVSDLCRTAAASERALQYAFKTILGLTPVAYLTRLRLHHVREKLLAATPRSTTVSIAAIDAGFWHFGEFSRAYRECFGELPSDTLRRATATTNGRKTAG
jgi:AraC-like DNA-binding protein